MSLDDLRAAIADCLRPGQFYLAPHVNLDLEHLERETLPWELFQGRLLDRRHTRQERTFEASNIYQIDNRQHSDEPLVAVKLDVETGEVHVTRGLLCYVQEGYHAGDNIYLTRETTRWTRELVRSWMPKDRPDRAALARGLDEAVRGQSRLPLTSLEAPLPGFTLGELFYCIHPTEREQPARSPRDLLAWPLADREAQRLEMLLRAASEAELPSLALGWFQGLKRGLDPGALLDEIFNGVALSPYTAFVDRTFQFLRTRESAGLFSHEKKADFLARLLVKLTRHLTAYDLVTFHYRGANYPDALLLDAALKELLVLVERHPDLFLSGDGAVKRRRALRQAWLMRRHYEGHPVPDAPTSPGENQRVLPAPHPRVPDEQILNVMKRKKRLYVGDELPTQVAEPLASVLRQCGDDLRQPLELREFGLALFIDRPFRRTLAPAEPDRTPLISYVAFSRSIAGRRLRDLQREPAFAIEMDSLTHALDQLPVKGLDIRTIPDDPRPVVSLADARKVAEDFQLLWSTWPAELDWLRQQAGLQPGQRALVVRGQGQVVVYDGDMRQRIAIIT